jgi:primosomal protein N' (replication factor Y)
MPDSFPLVLRVALPLPLPRLFDYLPPPGMTVDARLVGCRVRVGFGNKRMIGFVADIGPADADPAKLRAAEAILDDAAILDPELDASLRWAAGYYQRALGEVIATALPGPLRQGQPLPDTAHALWRLTEAGATALAGLRRGSRPRTLAERLQGGGQDEAALGVWSPQWRAALRALARRDLVERVWVTAPAPTTPRVLAPTLTAPQQAAVAAIEAALGGFAPTLLEGITGSGKTEVYLAAIEQTLARGEQALVLVPEIGLTPQTLARFRERLNAPVLRWHSGLAETVPARAPSNAPRGPEPIVVLGTRSAVFAPLPKLGLIVIDEEHDASFKQHEGFRYHARDVALVRAQNTGDVPVVLGSATPALESLANGERGRYRHLRLDARAGSARPPSVEVVDVRRERLHGRSRRTRARSDRRTCSHAANRRWCSAIAAVSRRFCIASTVAGTATASAAIVRTRCIAAAPVWSATIATASAPCRSNARPAAATA